MAMRRQRALAANVYRNYFISAYLAINRARHAAQAKLPLIGDVADAINRR